MPSQDPSTLFEQCSRALAQGAPLPVPDVARLLGVAEPVLDRLASLAYPLSRRQDGLQYLMRDLVLSLRQRAASSGLEAAVRELAGRALEPGPSLLAEFAAMHEGEPPAQP